MWVQSGVGDGKSISVGGGVLGPYSSAEEEKEELRGGVGRGRWIL